jgi:hypothetical protein
MELFALAAESFYFNLYNVPGLDIREAAGQCHAFGRTRNNDVSGLQHHVLAQVVDKRGGIKNQVRGGGVLASLAIHPRAQP